MLIPFPLVGLAAASGTGKTTLLLKIIPLLKARGLRIALIKRAHHTFDTDKPGKDSYELRKAGAPQVLVGSDHWWARVHRPSLGQSLLAASDRHIIAVATDTADAVRIGIPVLDLNRPEEITAFICERFVPHAMAGLPACPPARGCPGRHSRFDARVS